MTAETFIKKFSLTFRKKFRQGDKQLKRWQRRISAGQYVIRDLDQPVKISTNTLIDAVHKVKFVKSVKHKTIHQSNDGSINQSIQHSINQSINQTIDTPANENFTSSPWFLALCPMLCPSRPRTRSSRKSKFSWTLQRFATGLWGEADFPRRNQGDANWRK